MKKSKKTRLKKLCVVIAALASVLAIFIVMLLYKPAGLFNNTRPPAEEDVNKYITHVLSPRLYNGAQRQEPFDVTIPQNKTTAIVDLAEWPWESDGLRFSAPNIFFATDSLVVIGTVSIKDIDFAVTIVTKPAIDENGLLNFHLANVKIGTVNITPFAKMIGRKAYSDQTADKDFDTEKPGAKIADSLLNDKPFEPVFKIEDKKVRVEKITLELKKLTISFVPAE